MPADSSSLNNLLQRPTRFVVPFVGLFDDSPFGQEARRALEEAAEADFKQAILLGDAAHPEVVLGELLAVGFQQRLAPLRIWAEQPAWCVWFLGKKDVSPTDLCRLLESCSASYPPGVEHVVVVRLENSNNWQDWANLKLPSPIVGLLLLSENGAARRPLSLLARASAVHLHAAWVCHCRKGTGDTHKHLLMAPDRTTHTLGVSWCIPDVAYHAERWAGRIQSALLHEWMIDAPCTPPFPPFEPVLSSLRSLVPNPTGQAAPDYVVAPARASWDGPRISVAEESIGISGEFTALSCRRPERGNMSRGQLLAWLSAIRGLASFLGFSTVPNLKRMLDRNTAAQGSRWLQAAKDYLAHPANARGFLDCLRHRIEQSASWARDRANACVADSSCGGDLRHHERAALAKISRIPSPAGLLLRLLLVCVGLGSLATAPLWVPASAQAWQSELAQRTAFGAVGVCLLMSLFAAGYWYYSSWRALQAIVQARVNVLQGHLSKVAGMIAGALAENGQRVGEEVAKWGEAFDQLRRDLESKTLIPTDLKMTNKNPFFAAATLDALCLKRMPDLVALAHESFVAAIGSSELVSFQIQQWRKVLSEAAHTVAYSEVNRLTFAEWMTELNPTDEQRRHLTEDLARESRLPTLSLRQPANPPPVLLVGEADLARHSPGLGQIVCFDSSQHTLMAVSVIPVPQEDSTCSS